MHEYTTKPQELPPVEFRRLLKSGYESIATRAELKELILATLDQLNSLCIKAGEKCTLRLLLDAETPGAGTASYEVRILEKTPSDYYTIQNINGSGIGRVYSVLYEIFLVSDDIIEVETSRAQTMKLEIRHTGSIQETLESLLAALEYVHTPTQIPRQEQSKADETGPRDKGLRRALEACLEYARSHEPSPSQINMLLEAVVEGIGYHETSDGEVHCLMNTSHLTHWSSGECKYLLLTIREGEVQGTECYTDTTQILTTK